MFRLRKVDPTTVLNPSDSRHYGRPADDVVPGTHPRDLVHTSRRLSAASFGRSQPRVRAGQWASSLSLRSSYWFLWLMWADHSPSSRVTFDVSCEESSRGCQSSISDPVAAPNASLRPPDGRVTAWLTKASKSVSRQSTWSRHALRTEDALHIASQCRQRRR